MSNGIPWALDELETLRALDETGMGAVSISEILDRSYGAVKAKLAGIRGKAYRQTKRGPAKGQNVWPEYETPPRIRNNDHKHLQAILDAHRAGFPVCGRGRA